MLSQPCILCCCSQMSNITYYTLLQLTTTQTHSLHTTALSWNKELNLNTRRRMIKDFLVLNVYGMAERKMIPPKSKEE